MFGPVARLIGFGRRARRPRKINLALQGGGALGAFTWGVLDRLLEEEGLIVDTVSGASAGALNAVALASGLTTGGPSAAKEALTALWARIARSGTSLSALSNVASPWSSTGFKDAVAFWCPPDPLRGILKDIIDFDRLRSDSAVKLIVSATDLKTEQAHYFGAHELSVDVLMASSCLPMVHQPVVIDGRAYWDGGYSANPALLKLVEDSEADETLLIRLLPFGSDALPTKAGSIFTLLNQISFNRPLLAELEQYRRLKEIADGLKPPVPDALARIARHRLTEIDGAAHMGPNAVSKALYPSNALVTDLRKKGRAAAERWLSAADDLYSASVS